MQSEAARKRVEAEILTFDALQLMDWRRAGFHADTAARLRAAL